jgi:predicted permease
VIWRIRRFALRLWNALRRERAEPDLSREIESHLELLADDFRRRGLTPEDARVAARRAFGGIEQAKELQRDARAFRWIDDAARDVRYATQLLRRSPVFALTATLSLAIGIGATTTIFTVANGLLLRAPAGVPDPDRLVDIFHIEKGSGGLAGRMAGPMVPYSLYLDTRERTATLESVYAYCIELLPTSLRVSGGAERVFASLVSPNYFSALGVSARAGRVFSALESEQEASSAVVVLSHRFWTRRFQQDPSVVGQTLRLNGQPFTVVGVASESFQGTNVLAADVWVPAPMTETLRPGSSLSWMQVMMGGRLKPGVPVSQAAAELDLIGAIVYKNQPRALGAFGRGATETAPGLSVAAASPLPGPFRLLVATFLALLMGLVSLVLVIACANLAGVQLARASFRRREIAVRLALGAGRGRLIRQLLTETVLLFGLGGCAGLMLARSMTRLLVALLPAFPIPVALSLPLDVHVAAFAIGLTALAALLSGITPALQASNADVVTALKDDAQGSPERLRLRNAFVIVQVAFSLLLIVLAGLLGRALAHVTLVDRGFDSRGVELASLDLTQAGYTDATGPAFARELMEAVRRLPMVESATIADGAPMPNVVRGMAGEELTVPGVTPPPGQPFFNATWTIVEPGYFATLRIPLLAGRDFNPGDRPGADSVVIVPEGTARRLWPGQNAVGRYILLQSRRPGAPASRPAQTERLVVVGVAKDLTAGAPRVASTLQLYVPLQQRYTPEITIIARTAEGRRIAGDLRALVASTDPNLPVLSARTLEQEITGPVEVQLRVAASVSASVGVVSLLLATIGIYGITAYVASRRTREIGIRLALGAQRSDVLRMILRQGMTLVSIGVAIGLLLAAAGSQVLKTLLFGVTPLDPLTFVGATSCFAMIGVAACFLPAWRATRVDSVEALRYE